MYPMLIGAGPENGVIKIEFSSSDKHDDVVKRISDVYPRLVFSLCINPRMVEPNDPYKKLIKGGMLSNYEKNTTQEMG